MRFRRSLFADKVRGERWSAGVSLFYAEVLLVCISAGRKASLRMLVFFCASPISIFTNWVGGENRISADLTPSGDAFSMHARESGTRARPTFCFTSLAVQFSVSAGQRVALLVALYPRRRHV